EGKTRRRLLERLAVPIRSISEPLEKPGRRRLSLGDRVGEAVGAERASSEFEAGMPGEPRADPRRQRGVADPALRHRRGMTPDAAPGRGLPGLPDTQERREEARRALDQLGVREAD